MIYQKKFLRNTLAVISISIAALSLSACGGASTDAGATTNIVNAPDFFRSKITQSPRYAPSGDITQTQPTFSWQAIANATDYRFGHENTADENQWHLYYTSPTQAACQNVGDTCEYTPSDFTFPLNIEKVWWVQAKVNGSWQDWSKPIVFTVVNGANNGSTPTPIAPTGGINTLTPKFSWTGINGASAYKLGYEDANTSEGWQAHDLSSTDANCQSAQNCSYTPSNPNFTAGQNIAWWIKAKVNGVWGDWSNVTVFNVLQGQSARPFVLKVRGYKTGFRQIRYFKDFTIFANGSGYNYNVDCDSDGNFEASNVSGNYTCHYPDLSEYRLSITGSFPRFTISNGFPSKNQEILRGVEQWGTQKWQSMANAFSGMSSLKITATDTPDLSQASSMAGMFSGLQVLQVNNISEWDVSHITNMRRLFSGIGVFNGDLSSWDVSNVTDMSFMFFYNKIFNQNISNWNVGKVTNMSAMFRNAFIFNQDLSNWDVSNVTDMSEMFDTTDFNQPIGNWDVSKVTNMNRMLKSTDFNQDISSWNVSKVTNMQAMFSSNTAFNQNIRNWDVSNVTDMENMFSGSKFDQNISNWDISRVSNMRWMFEDGSLSTANYDSLLNNWSRFNLQQNVPFSAGNTKYSTSSANARAILANQFHWQITDGGQL